MVAALVLQPQKSSFDREVLLVTIQKDIPDCNSVGVAEEFMNAALQSHTKRCFHAMARRHSLIHCLVIVPLSKKNKPAFEERCYVVILRLRPSLRISAEQYTDGILLEFLLL